jgi:CRP-like cAMP-binding protein
MSIAEISGYAAAALVFLTFYTKTMIPLRILGICSNCAFIFYGYLGHLYPVLILHLILLPLNGMRLREMLALTRQVREATRGDSNMNWLKPFTTKLAVKAGELVFRKGDFADHMFVVISGRFRLTESGIEILPAAVLGEFALFTPERTRSQTLECIEGGVLLQISYSQVEQLFFQSPKFAFYFLQLITQRLLQNNARLEIELARCRGASA